MDPQQERELTRGLASGNPDAWRGLYDAYAQPVWRVVARLMGPTSADVADVVQETFLAAARSAKSFDPARGTLWLWLCGIARRHVALHYRKHERHARIREASDRLGTAGENGEVVRWIADRQPPPSDVLASAELATLVRAALTALSEDHGSLLVARYLEDIPVEQIADAEQCSSTAIRSRLARARQAFREKFTRLTDGAVDELMGAPHEA
jgi:RNA polymerase sigma-70 factor (ECF subfamily)